jgi:hypothetical protein
VKAASGPAHAKSAGGRRNRRRQKDRNIVGAAVSAIVALEIELRTRASENRHGGAKCDGGP